MNNQTDLTEKLRNLAICGYQFSAAVDINNNDLELSQKLLDKVTIAKRLRSKIGKDHILFSDKNIESCFALFRSNYAKNNPAFLEMSKMEIKTKVFDETTPNKLSQKRWAEIMRSFGYRSRGVSIFRLPLASPLIGICTVYSEKPADEFSKLIINNEEFSDFTSELAKQYFSEHGINRNPWVSLGAISNKSHAILHHLSLGLDTQEIADATSMTKRGVDYHIESMKELFNAKNRIQLVVKALKAGVIT